MFCRLVVASNAVLTGGQADKQYNIELIRRECNKLQPYIVDSPEKLHQTINDLNNTLANERAELDATERQVRALQTSADSFAIVEQDVNSCIKLMEDCENELAKEEESIRKSNRHEEILHQKEAEVREHDRKEDRVRRLIANANEKLEKARVQAAEKQAAARKEMEKLAAEYETLSKERDATNKENDRTNLEIERKQKEVCGIQGLDVEELGSLMSMPDGRDEGQLGDGGAQCADRVREARVAYRPLHSRDAAVNARWLSIVLSHRLSCHYDNVSCFAVQGAGFAFGICSVMGGIRTFF